MAKKRRKRVLHITNLGKATLSLAIFVVVAIVVLANLPGSDNPVPVSVITGSGSPLGLESKASADATPVPTATPTPAPSPTPTIRLIVTPAPDVYYSPTPSPANVSRTPTQEEVRGAVEAKITGSKVTLRAGPSTDDKALKTKIPKKTRVKVFAREGDFYFVQLITSGDYGYIAAQFIEVAGFTPEPIATQIPQGAVGGEVSSKSLMLRSGPGTDYPDLHTYTKDTLLYVYFQTNDWYYVEVCRDHRKGYMKADHVSVRTAPPAGTPVP